MSPDWVSEGVAESELEWVVAGRWIWALRVAGLRMSVLRGAVVSAGQRGATRGRTHSI